MSDNFVNVRRRVDKKTQTQTFVYISRQGQILLSNNKKNTDGIHVYIKISLGHVCFSRKKLHTNPVCNKKTNLRAFL